MCCACSVIIQTGGGYELGIFAISRIDFLLSECCLSKVKLEDKNTANWFWGTGTKVMLTSNVVVGYY